MTHRSAKRQTVWQEMQLLENAQLGSCQVVSELRDKFLIDNALPVARILSCRPEADGFIRSDDDSLLFRYASDELCALLLTPELRQHVKFDKGFELRWTAIDISDINRFFAAIRQLAAVNI
jgi:hypothetical protein